MPPKRDVAELLERLNASDESVEIEAKRGGKIGKSILETICAFANEPDRGGGYIVLGVEETDDRESFFDEDRFRIGGVEDVEKLQNDAISAVKGQTFNQPIEVEIDCERIGKTNVLVIRVAEAMPQSKPIYFVKERLPGAGRRRIGSADVRLTDEDLQMFALARAKQSFDEIAVVGSTIDHIDPDAVERYRRLRAKAEPDAEILTYDDPDLLDALFATVRHEGQICLTHGGLMLFGTKMAHRRYVPMANIDYIKTSHPTWVEDPNNPYDYSQSFSGSMLKVIPSLVSTILGDLPRPFGIEPDGIHRLDPPILPERVIREAVVNAIMHRTYQKHSPIQVIRFPNRIEIHNIGYSLKPVEELGQVKSVPRNPRIAAVLRDVRFAETKGTGIRTMRRLLKEANLTQPVIESNRESDSFSLTLWIINLLTPEDWKWLGKLSDCNLDEGLARALIVVREQGRIDNATYRDINGVDTLTASQKLARLRKLDLLQPRDSGSRTYYVPGARLRAVEISESRPIGGWGANSTGSVESEGASSTGSAKAGESSSTGSAESGSASSTGSAKAGESSSTGSAESGGANSTGSAKARESSSTGSAQSGAAGSTGSVKRKRPEPFNTMMSDLTKRAAEIGLPAPAERFLDVSTWQELDRKAQNRLVIRHLCQRQALSSQQLAHLLQLNPIYLINQYLTQMVRNGELQHVYPQEANNPKQAYRTVAGEKLDDQLDDQ